MCLLRCVWVKILVLGKLKRPDVVRIWQVILVDQLSSHAFEQLFSFSEFASSKETMAISFSNHTIIANLAQV